jgi:hypothetical protein
MAPLQTLRTPRIDWRDEESKTPFFLHIPMTTERTLEWGLA